MGALTCGEPTRLTLQVRTVMKGITTTSIVRPRGLNTVLEVLGGRGHVFTGVWISLSSNSMVSEI